MKVNQIKSIAAALALALVAFGCGKSETSSTPAAGGGKKLKLAFVSNNASPFWTIARAGCNDAAKELGNVDVDFRIPSSGSLAEQQQILDDLAAKGIDSIAVSPHDPAHETATLNQLYDHSPPVSRAS